jgi:hypothetical protein
MFACFTRKEIAIFILFLCVEFTLLLIGKFQSAAEEGDLTVPVVDGVFVFESHASNNFCSIYRSDNLLTNWKRVDGSTDEYANTDFLKGPTYRLPPRGNGTEFVPGTTVIVSRWAPYNPYEAMHAIFNYYVLTKRFRLGKPKIIFDDRWKDQVLKDRELYGAMSSAIIEGKLENYTFENVVHMNKPSKCFLTAIPSGGNQGMCQIELYQEFVEDLTKSLGLPRTKRLRFGPVKKVFWSSRQPYQRAKLTQVHRAMPDEEFFLKSLQSALGSNYELISHDFGNYTWGESIKIAGTGNAMVGVHGAGLQWSAWLPRGAPLVEIFGGDRGPSNKHYRFLSKALGRPYSSCNAPNGHISWNENLVDCIAKSIKSNL